MPTNYFTHREAGGGKPPQWDAHGRFPAHGALQLLHRGDPPAAIPPAPSRRGVPPAFCLSSSYSYAAWGKRHCRTWSAGLSRRAGSSGGAESTQALPLVAASVLDPGHYESRPSGSGNGILVDGPTEGAPADVTPPRRLGWRSWRERARFRLHAAAIADPAGSAFSSPGVGEVPLFNLHKYHIVAMLGMKEMSVVALGMAVDTGAGLNLVHRNALSPNGCSRWGPPVRRSRCDSDTPRSPPHAKSHWSAADPRLVPFNTSSFSLMLSISLLWLRLGRLCPAVPTAVELSAAALEMKRGGGEVGCSLLTSAEPPWPSMGGSGCGGGSVVASKGGKGRTGS